MFMCACLLLQHLRNCAPSLVSLVSDVHRPQRVPTQARAISVFVGYTCQLCPSYGYWHHARGQLSSRGHFVDAHLERRQFDCGPCGFLFGHVASSVLLWLSRRLWTPLVAHTRSPFQSGCQFTGSASLRQHRWARL